MEPSAEEIYAALQQAVQANPSLKSKFKASVEFTFKEEPNKKYRLDVTSNPKEKADLVVSTTLKVFHQILNKKLTPQQAFMQGKLKIKGNMGLAMKLTLIINAARKQLKKPRSRL